MWVLWKCFSRPLDMQTTQVLECRAGLSIWQCLMLYLVYLIKMRITVLRFCLFEKLLFLCAGVFLKEGACPVTWLQLLPGVRSDFKAVGCAGACSYFITPYLLRKLLCYMWNTPKELSAAVPSDHPQPSSSRAGWPNSPQVQLWVKGRYRWQV